MGQALERLTTYLRALLPGQRPKSMAGQKARRRVQPVEIAAVLHLLITASLTGCLALLIAAQAGLPQMMGARPS